MFLNLMVRLKLSLGVRTFGEMDRDRERFPLEVGLAYESSSGPFTGFIDMKNNPKNRMKTIMGRLRLVFSYLFT
ncbi:hypothetical protein EP1X_08785 [Thermococcus sp. EP1]|nr:hypothetical protein EP1X_08785 [Thermococcus sp. EP1]